MYVTWNLAWWTRIYFLKTYFNNICGDSNALSNKHFSTQLIILYCLASTPWHKIKYLQSTTKTFKWIQILSLISPICQQTSWVGLQVLRPALIICSKFHNVHMLEHLAQRLLCQPSHPEISGKIRFAQDWSYSLVHILYWSDWIQIKTDYYIECTVSFQHKVPAEASWQGQPFFGPWTIF